ncbi:hypothetical protein FNU76_17585 [Chitinimonas arctica]|uniref:Uncharacterized protein n=1 Tax=Chitinimonas arctica TaxID=2594795 RepID=A0A516SIM6_9NEIS|nr:hypothetical protein [Chitinimonas arctica]QDQ28010.1 hypothetical protein FNU76_17585 [Chitinimonas arctica]
MDDDQKPAEQDGRPSRKAPTRASGTADQAPLQPTAVNSPPSAESAAAEAAAASAESPMTAAGPASPRAREAADQAVLHATPSNSPPTSAAAAIAQPAMAIGIPGGMTAGGAAPGGIAAAPAPANQRLAMPADEVVASLERESQALSPAHQRHLHSHMSETVVAGTLFNTADQAPYQPLTITLQNVRANSKVLITIRDDQMAIWSEGHGHGLVGLSFATTKDPTLYLRNFLINAREFFVQTYQDCQEIQVQLYVRSAQRDLRGRVDLPPGAIATFQSKTDRTSVVGLSAFAIEF